MEEVEKRRAERAAEAARRRFLEQTQVIQRQLPRPILPPLKPLSSSLDAAAVVAAAVQQQLQQDENTPITEEAKDAAVAAISEANSLTDSVMVSTGRVRLKHPPRWGWALQGSSYRVYLSLVYHPFPTGPGMPLWAVISVEPCVF